MSPCAVWLSKDGASDVVASNVIVETSDSMTCALDVGLAPFGIWDVFIRILLVRPILPSGFRIIEGPAPVISAVSPDSGYVGFPVHIDSITGANFLAGAGVQFQKSGESSIIASDVVVGSPGFISCDFDLTGAAVGPWDVVVVNPDGQRDTLAQGFQISTASAPEIHSIDPAMGDVDDVVYIRALEGTGFLPTTAPRLEKPGEPDIAATNITIASPESITCYFDLTDVAVGYWDVVVENGDGQQDILEDGFTVLALPIVDLIDPESWEVGETVTLPILRGAGSSIL